MTMSTMLDSVLDVTQLEKATDGLSPKEVAEQLGVSSQTVRNWIDRGVLPATRFGDKIIRIHPDDVARMRNPA